VVDDEGRLLLGVRTKPPLEGYWVLPGGGVHPFESLAEAVEREVLEETGLIVRAREQLGVWEVVEPPDQHRVIVYSRAEIVGGRLNSGDDLHGATFWAREDLADLELTPLVADVLRRLGWLEVTAETSPQNRHAA
jgi:8-oxo-dGTP diphosphatase